MIVLTRVDGTRIALNPDRVDHVLAISPTVIIMVGGERHEVVENVDTVVSRVREYRASVMTLADQLEIREHPSVGHYVASHSETPLRLVPTAESGDAPEPN